MIPRKNKVRKQSTYDEALKIAVTKEYLYGDLSLNQVAKKYGLPGEATVRWFIKWYNKHYSVELKSSNASPPQISGQVNQDQLNLLTQQLADANLKVTALEIMIDIAEKDLGVEIRKKRGTKQ